MRKLTDHRRLRFIAVALLVSAGFSAGMRHAHPGGGGWQHRHDHDSALAGDFQFPGTEHAGWFSTPLHMHIFVLGFQFTLPADEQSQGQENHGERPVMLHLAADDLADSAARFAVTDWHSLPAIMPQIDQCAVATDDFRSPAPGSLSALPLCDSARHERSGVQRT